MVVRTDELTDASLHIEPVHALGLTLSVHVPQGLTDVQGHIITACDLSAILYCLTLASICIYKILCGCNHEGSNPFRLASFIHLFNSSVVFTVVHLF